MKRMRWMLKWTEDVIEIKAVTSAQWSAAAPKHARAKNSLETPHCCYCSSHREHLTFKARDFRRLAREPDQSGPACTFAPGVIWCAEHQTDSNRTSSVRTGSLRGDRRVDLDFFMTHVLAGCDAKRSGVGPGSKSPGRGLGRSQHSQRQSTTGA